MKKNTKENSLDKVNTRLIQKIKNFFSKIFKKEKDKESVNECIEKNTFKEEVKDIAHEDIELLNLQLKFKNGELKDGELTQEQINKLLELYDKQIEETRKQIEERKQKIEKYKKVLNKENNNSN